MGNMHLWKLVFSSKQIIMEMKISGTE
jgi:hypothetical protein